MHKENPFYNMESDTHQYFHSLHIWCPTRPEECIRSAGPRNIGSSEPSDWDARKQIWVPKRSGTTESPNMSS